MRPPAEHRRAGLTGERMNLGMGFEFKGVAPYVALRQCENGQRAGSAMKGAA